MLSGQVCQILQNCVSVVPDSWFHINQLQLAISFIRREENFQKATGVGRPIFVKKTTSTLRPGCTAYSRILASTMSNTAAVGPISIAVNIYEI